MTDRPFWDGVFEALRPLPLIGIPEWAELYRVLSSKGTSEKGPWRNSRTPYLIEIMNELSPRSRTKEIVVAKGTQLGISELAINWFLYKIHLQPTSLLYLMPSQDSALSFSKQRFNDAIESCEALKDILKTTYFNGLLEKVIGGSYVTLRGANSPTGLSSNPFSDIVADEIDRFKPNVGKEGNPLEIVKRRQTNYPNGKILQISSPGLKETSIIWPLYEESDQRVYMVQCPHCKNHEQQNDSYFELKIELLKWTRNLYTDAMIYCPYCGVGIPEYHKTAMLAGGKWVKQNPGHWRAGFHINSLYSPLGWYSWESVAKNFDGAANDPEKRQVFVNTTLGLPYENTGEAIAQEYLSRRIEMYNAQVPDGVLQLTMAVDVQKTRLEYEIRGWGKGEESWGIEYGHIPGPTTELDSGDDELPSVWRRLDELRIRGFTREDGYEMRISCVMIDSGGLKGVSDTVYKYTLKRERMRVYAIKGSNKADDTIYNRPKRTKFNNCALFMVGTHKAKELIHSRLYLNNKGIGYCHFPDDDSRGYDSAYYAGLMAEKLKTKTVKGRDVFYWEKDRDVHNEPFDLFVYNLMAIRYLNPNWDALEARYKRAYTPMNTTATILKTASPHPARSRLRRPEGISLHA